MQTEIIKNAHEKRHTRIKNTEKQRNAITHQNFQVKLRELLQIVFILFWQFVNREKRALFTPIV